MRKNDAMHGENHTKRRFAAFPVFLLTLLAALLVFPATAPGNADSGTPENNGWRLKIKEAAVVRGEAVLLGEIADPVGPLDPAIWNRLAASSLWPSPPPGRPMSMTRPKIQQAMTHYARELSSMCLYPASMTLQRGGSVLDGEALRSLVAKTLTPMLGTLPGEASLQDFRLPSALFLAREDQVAELEGPVDLVPGRLGLRIAVKEADGSVVRRVTGTVFLDLWTEVASAAVPLNKDEVLTPERVTFTRKNLAHMKGEIWDGKGGPWRMQRAVSAGQPIFQNDVSVIPAVRKGATVTMVYEGKNVTLSIPGQALGDGAHGETIPVRNLQSKKELRATVRDGLTVVVR